MLELKKGIFLMVKKEFSLLIIVILIILMIMGCSSNNKNISSSEHMENDTSIEVMLSNDISLDEIAKNLFEKYLMRLMKEQTPESQRIKDYLVDSIKIETSKDTGFEFSVFYSVLPDSKRYILTGSGIQGDNGWISGKYYLVKVSKRGNLYIITQLATGK